MPICARATSGDVERKPRIAIVGRGFSGAAAAAALLRTLEGAFSLVLIDESDTFGGGLAYGKARAGELLNVRARDLSLVAGERGDFTEWLRNRLIGGSPQSKLIDLGQIFAPRTLFADYVRDRLFAEIIRRPDAPVQRVDGHVVALMRRPGNGLSLAFDEGPPVVCDAAILAMGYGARNAPRTLGLNPFALYPENAVASAKEIILVGSGLTMVDALLRLRRAECAARITVISRHGLLPRPQLKTSPTPERWRGLPTDSICELAARVRAACAEAVAGGDSWQSVINGLRPHVQSLWAALPVAEQRRFLRHLRAFWDVHRHRLPADIYERVQREFSGARTTIRAGRVFGIEGGGPYSVEVKFRGRTETETRSADLVFDCSGHRPDLDSPLIRSIVENGYGAIDPHRIGLNVETDGRLRLPGGGRSPNIFAIGPLGAGSLVEITAAPEIALQAEAMAATLNVQYAGYPARIHSRARGFA